MAFTPQNDDGTVADANAYGSLAGFKAYHTDRGNNFEDIAADGDASIEQSIIKATDYVDNRFNYVGWKRHSDQTTQWPRAEAYDRDMWPQRGIPEAIIRATYEYAFRALSSPIDPDPVRHESGRIVVRQSETLGPLSQSVEYAQGGTPEVPRYPTADRILSASGLTIGGTTGGFAVGEVVRG